MIGQLRSYGRRRGFTPLSTRRTVLRGGDGRTLPERYEEPWKQAFRDYVTAVVEPDVSILDVGSGRAPTIPVDLRPPGCRYVGLDVSAQELDRAPEGSYDEAVVADLLEVRAEMIGEFDLVVTWQVLEHVRSLQASFDVIRSYLRPGGHLAALLSGRWAMFAVANRLIPHALGVRLMKAKMDRDPATVFPAYYDRATKSGIAEALTAWSEVDIVPRYRGAEYLNPFPRMRSIYLAYEEWARKHPNLATHYLIFARR